jgi:hypothetical protein
MTARASRTPRADGSRRLAEPGAQAGGAGGARAGGGHRRPCVAGTPSGESRGRRGWPARAAGRMALSARGPEPPRARGEDAAADGDRAEKTAYRTERKARSVRVASRGPRPARRNAQMVRAARRRAARGQQPRGGRAAERHLGARPQPEPRRGPAADEPHQRDVAREARAPRTPRRPETQAGRRPRARPSAPAKAARDRRRRAGSRRPRAGRPGRPPRPREPPGVREDEVRPRSIVRGGHAAFECLARSRRPVTDRISPRARVRDRNVPARARPGPDPAPLRPGGA